MLKPSFSRPILPLPPAQTTPPTSSNETASDASNRSSAIPICHMQPAAVRNGNTLARIKDDLDAYYTRELRTERLDEIKTYLWLAGLPSCARALHRQQLLGREILITEDPNEHLVWHETHIFVKPLPTFLFNLDCWTQTICKTKQLYEAACGFLLSYAWLVRHESDLRIAHEKALLPHVRVYGRPGWQGTSSCSSVCEQKSCFAKKLEKFSRHIPSLHSYPGLNMQEIFPRHLAV